MKKMFAMMIAMVMILTTAALGAPQYDKFEMIRSEDILAPLNGQWSAVARYEAGTDSVIEVEESVLVLEFDGDDVLAGVYTEESGVRYQETVNYMEGYLTFAPDGVVATETFVVFPMQENMLGVYQAADGKLFAEEAPVDFYMLKPIAAEEIYLADAGLYNVVLYLMGDDIAAKMTDDDRAQLAGYAAELEDAIAVLFGMTEQELDAFVADIRIGLEKMPAEDRAELDAFVAGLRDMIGAIPEEFLMAADLFLDDIAIAFENLSAEDVAELEAMMAELGEAIAAIDEEDLIAAGEFIEDVFVAIGEMTEEELAELEGMLAELGEAIAAIDEEDLIAAGEFIEDMFVAIGEMTEEELAELEAKLIELGEAIAAIDEEDLIELGEFIDDMMVAIDGMTEEEVAELEAKLVEMSEIILSMSAEELEVAADIMMGICDAMMAPAKTVSIAGFELTVGFPFNLMI